MVLAKKNTFLINTLHKFWWECLEEIHLNTQSFHKKLHKYQLVRILFARTHQKHHVFLVGIHNVFHAQSLKTHGEHQVPK